MLYGHQQKITVNISNTQKEGQEGRYVVVVALVTQLWRLRLIPRGQL